MKAFHIPNLLHITNHKTSFLNVFPGSTLCRQYLGSLELIARERRRFSFFSFPISLPSGTLSFLAGLVQIETRKFLPAFPRKLMQTRSATMLQEIALHGTELVYIICAAFAQNASSAVFTRNIIQTYSVFTAHYSIACWTTLP